MKKFLIILLSSMMVFACDKDAISPEQAENFIKYYTNYPEFTAADVAITGSNGYAVLGTAKTDQGLQICLILTDIFGNIKDTATYGRSANDVARCLRALDDGGFAILATSENPETSTIEGYFIRTDNQGNALWTHVISVPELVELNSFEVDGAGMFFIIGSMTEVDRGMQVFLMALTANGTDHWIRSHGLERDEEGAHLQILDNGYLVLTGRARIAALYKSFVIVTNESGLVLNGFIVDQDSPGEDEGTCLRMLDANNFLLLSTSRISGMSHINLRRINISDMSSEWSQNYSTSDQDVSRAVLYNGNKIFMLGSKSISATNKAITVISADNQGNQTARFDFGEGTELTGVAFNQTPDGGLIIVGTNANTEENNTSIALIKTDSGLGL